MQRLQDKLFTFAACSIAMAGVAVLVCFALTGEILVRRGSATFAEQPLSVAISLAAFAVMTVAAGVCAYLQWTGSKISEDRFRALDQRRRLDIAQRQDRQGRAPRPPERS